MQDVRSRLTDDAKSFGIEILDVRIKRVDFVGSSPSATSIRATALRATSQNATPAKPATSSAPAPAPSPSHAST